MSLEGLVTPRNRNVPLQTADLGDVVGVTIEMYRELGFEPPVDEITEKLTDSFTEQILPLGREGRLFVKTPAAVSTQQLLDAAEGKKPENVASVYKWPNFWVPGTEKQSVTMAELDQAPEQPVARIALFNSVDTGVDPVLHCLGLPYDDYAKKRWGGETTQLTEAEKLKQEFEAENAGSQMEFLDERDFLTLALMDRIRGVSTAEQILSRGFMRIVRHGRRTVDGDSVVGSVRSHGGRLGFDDSDGLAYGSIGVGLSAGQVEA